MHLFNACYVRSNKKKVRYVKSSEPAPTKNNVRRVTGNHQISKVEIQQGVHVSSVRDHYYVKSEVY